MRCTLPSFPLDVGGQAETLGAQLCVSVITFCKVTVSHRCCAVQFRVCTYLYPSPQGRVIFSVTLKRNRRS